MSDKGYHGPPGWGLGVRLTSLPSKNSTLKTPAKDTMAQKQAECHRRQRQIKRRSQNNFIPKFSRMFNTYIAFS
jgi:hypothetical protein